VSPSDKIWNETVRVRSYEAGADGCASILSICNYLQEAAGNHAFALGVAIDQLAAQNLFWVLSRLRVRMDTYPKWRDEIRITTWPCGVERLFAHRDFEIYGPDGRRLGVATSAWLLLDIQKRRPTRMLDVVRNFAVTDRARAFEGDLGTRLAPPPRADAERVFRVRLSDLDVNRHVNNVNYIEWAVETVPPGAGTLIDLQVEFLAESLSGDEVISRCAGEGQIYQHELVRSSDRKTLALVRTEWQGSKE
jgi:medium-chain acyl-[acyl-carrier-protein] hydrolase